MVRYRDLVDDPRSTVDRVSRFLGIREGMVDAIPRDNARSFVPPGWRPRVLGPVVRGGARLGQFAPPQVWRRLHPPFISLLSDGSDARRPRLDATQRRRLQEAFVDDIDLLDPAHGTGLRRLALPREPRLLRRACRDGHADQRTQVTRSCAPSGRAAST